MMRWVGLAMRYTGWQACALALQVVAGFVVVRLLDVGEYARLSIVLGVVSAAITVADGGICNALNARGANAGTASVLGAWLTSARRVAITRLPWVVLGAMGLAWVLLRNDHATAAFATFGALFVGAYLCITLARMLVHVIARLRCAPVQVLAVDTGVDCAKPVVTVLVLLAWPAAAAALLVPLLASAVHGAIYRRLTRPLVAAAPPEPAQTADLAATTRPMLPVTIFFAFQGQIALWVVSALGTTGDVAGLGALGRFAMIFSLAAPFLANVLSPRIAAIAGPHLRLRVFQTFVATLAVVAVVVLASAAFADDALALLGPAYAGFKAEFIAVMAVAAVHFAAGVVNTINASRAWYARYWLIIPVTLAAQAASAACFDVSTLIGAIALSGASGLALLAVYGSICAVGVAKSGPAPRAA